jgi:hypothetical protein
LKWNVVCLNKCGDGVKFLDNNVVKYDPAVIIFRAFSLDTSSDGDNEEDLP